jgi:hypothetical protein
MVYYLPYLKESDTSVTHTPCTVTITLHILPSGKFANLASVAIGVGSTEVHDITEGQYT